MVDSAIARAHAYAEAGASGFFVPGLGDLALLERVCRASPLPVNFMAYPGAPSAAEVARAGVARISHGPFPYYLAMEAFETAARAAFGTDPAEERRSEEHTSELQSLMRISYAVFCLKKKKE